MSHMCGACGSSNFSSGTALFYTQSENTVSLPFNNETTVMTLPVVSERSLQPIKIDCSVQVAATISLGLTSFSYTLILRLYRNGLLLTTKTLSQGAASVLSLAFTQTAGIPLTFVDSTSLLGTNNYSVTLIFSQRSSASVSTAVQSRAINATVFYK